MCWRWLLVSCCLTLFSAGCDPDREYKAVPEGADDVPDALDPRGGVYDDRPLRVTDDEDVPLDRDGIDNDRDDIVDEPDEDIRPPAVQKLEEIEEALD